MCAEVLNGDKPDSEETSSSEEASEEDEGLETVWELRRISADELDLPNHRHRGKWYFMTYGGGPEGGYCTFNSEGGTPVWSLNRTWNQDWAFRLLAGMALDTMHTDEGVFKCRLRNATPDDRSNRGNDESGEDSESSESEEDEGEPDAMDAATVFGTESANDSSNAHTWSEVRNDKLHMTMAAARAIAATRATTAAYEKDDMSVAFSAWRVCVEMARVEKSAPYRVLWFSVFGLGLWSKLGFPSVRLGCVLMGFTRGATTKANRREP